DVFKTAPEIDQRWLIEHAADRATFICQAQSLNVFMPGNVHKKYLHEVHFQAWKKGVKSLYYCRSTSVQRAEKVSHAAQTGRE
ncbi:MAG: ribonucleotide-diphosphate reductase subunit alpha, partial [Rickettsiales bacterium]|nr:ribonucleotide-diphosphate reductase subunit alpha [Rickettsiales bacterium]